MNRKYQKITDAVITDLLERYRLHIEKSKDLQEYYAIVTGGFIFQKMIAAQVAETVRQDNECPEEIIAVIDEMAEQLAASHLNNDDRSNNNNLKELN